MGKGESGEGNGVGGSKTIIEDLSVIKRILNIIKSQSLRFKGGQLRERRVRGGKDFYRRKVN